MSVPVIRYDERAARQAFDAFMAAVNAECRDPSLVSNPVWQAIKKQVAEQFKQAFEVLA